jgi:DNA primase
MSGVAFHVQGRAITVEQCDAGIAAMRGTFRADAVRRALERAGVEDEPGRQWTVERAANRLMQVERKAGRIRAINNKVWEETVCERVR